MKTADCPKSSDAPQAILASSAEQPVARPKLVRIIARLNVGGPARQACMLHEKQAPYLETRLMVGSLDDEEADMSYLLTSEHNVLRLPRMSREISLWSDFLAFWSILRFLHKERPDIVHTHTAKAGTLGRLAAWLTRVPVIVHTYHGHVFAGYFGAFKTKLYVTIERLMGKISTQVIAVSESQRRELCSKYHVVPPQKIAVINNGFEFAHSSQMCRQEARQRLGLKPGDFVVIWAARMVPVKNVQLLGRVIQMAAAGLNQIRFLVVGDGQERHKLESLIDGCKNAQLMGWQRDMNPVWAAADLALLTSSNEGTPTILIEAMAAGLPFVATDVGGVKDLAIGPLSSLPSDMGYRAANGFLTVQTPEALLYGIGQIEKNPQEARRMGVAGRTFALERFSADRLVKDLNSLYWSLLMR